MVHDWFVHKRSAPTDGIDIPLAPGDDWSDATMRVPRTRARPGAGRIDAPARLRQPEQPLVGRVAGLRLRRRALCDSLRTTSGGKLKIRADRAAAGRSGHRHRSHRLHRQLVDRPRDAAHALHAASTTTSATCSRTKHPTWTDEQLFRKAKLINSALMAKIHTVEWTPAILPHPIIEARDARELVGRRRRGSRRRSSSSSTTTSSSAASSARTPTITRAPYSLTEEFVSVYRMHPLIPDDVVFQSATTEDGSSRRSELPDIAGRKTPAGRRAHLDAGSVLLVRRSATRAR